MTMQIPPRTIKTTQGQSRAELIKKADSKIPDYISRFNSLSYIGRPQFYSHFSLNNRVYIFV